MSSDKDSANKHLHADRPLAELLNHLAGQAPHKYAGKTQLTSDSVLLGEPPEVEYFQKTWSRLSTGLRLRQSQRQVPENAGPLNSTQLIHRSLLLMKERSPEYLQHFLSYIDTLSWMEQLNANASASSARTSSKAPNKAPNKAPTKAPAKAAPKPATKTAAKKPARKAR